ncbi:MAG TPA: large conductance mechanosensitive channel protein MscL [Acidimicrobiia bacterium]|nr:large conductance mechanosensitive channel protein MscL [Acidimicrobiia bacterium]
MVQEFKTFVSRGNLVEIAVGLVMALAFKAVVDAFVGGIVMPIVGAIFGEPSFDNLTFTINDSVFLYGTVLTQVVTFLLIALALFLFVVKPFNEWQKRQESGEEPAPAAPPEDVVLLREIRDALQR